MRRRWLPVLFGALLVVLLAQAGCATQVTITIAGTVLGDSLSASVPGATDPVAATVTCNGVSTTAGSDGRYTLKVPQASSGYTCKAGKQPSYAVETVRIAGRTQSPIELNFGASSASACRLAVTSAAVNCEQLHFQPGSLRGSVAYANSGAPAAGITVQCPDLAHFASSQVTVNWLHTKTDQTGSFSLPGVAAGTYTCLARDDHDNMTGMSVTIKPGNTAQASFSICTADCPPVHYHYGNVMHQYHAYLIYWAPAGSPLEPGGGDARFKSLVERYFRDVGGTPFFGILSQYWDYQGFVRNTAALAGTWTDTTAYQHCTIGATSCRPARADQSDPLLDGDIQAEVTRAIKANAGWHAGLDTEFVVLTGLGAEECFTSDANSDCSYKTNHGFCGYHSAFHSGLGDAGLADEAIYAYVPNVGNDGGLCTFSDFTSPNGDIAADSTITIASHEQFESISDPLPDDAPGWFDDGAMQSREGGEIADKCVRYFGTIRPDGSNVTLANGDRYLVQGEWSNKVGGCTLG